jgi:hypothetical protein
MKNICWTLILLAALAFVMGTWLAFTKAAFILEPVGFWRGGVPRIRDRHPADGRPATVALAPSVLVKTHAARLDAPVSHALAR